MKKLLLILAAVATLSSGVQAQDSRLKSAVKSVISKVKGDNISKSDLADYLGYLLLKLDHIRGKAGMPQDLTKKDIKGKGLEDIMEYIFNELDYIEKKI